MLDVAGKDADEFFEDIGHSKEARSELEKYLIGTYKESEEELRQKALALEQKKSSTGNSSFMIVLVLYMCFCHTVVRRMAKEHKSTV